MTETIPRFRARCLAVATLCLTGFPPAHAADETRTVFGMFWTGCEEACQGFQDYFAEKEIPIDFVVRDAGRDRSKLPEFLGEARAGGADLILTWGTSVTLGIAGTLEDLDDPAFNHTIPQVFTVVADPVGAGVIESLESTGRPNITGTFNRVPEAVNIHTIRSFKPDFRRLGMLYNDNERNSVLKHEEISSLQDTLGFELVALKMEPGPDGKPLAEDIPGKVAELKALDVDFIYVGSSSFLDANRDLFTDSAVANGIPVLSPYERFVRNSRGLLSIAARYYDVGRLAARQAEKILFEGAEPGALPVARITEFAYVVNMAVARELGLFPSVEILQIAETVN